MCCRLCWADAEKVKNDCQQTTGSRVVIPQKVEHYRNKYDEAYQRKLELEAADIKAGAIDQLTMKIGRERYRMRDTRTRQAQIDLCRDGLLFRQGRRFAVVA